LPIKSKGRIKKQQQFSSLKTSSLVWLSAYFITTAREPNYIFVQPRIRHLLAKLVVPKSFNIKSKQMVERRLWMFLDNEFAPCVIRCAQTDLSLAALSRC